MKKGTESKDAHAPQLSVVGQPTREKGAAASLPKAEETGVRTGRVRDLREALASGTYFVSNDQLAERLLQSLLGSPGKPTSADADGTSALEGDSPQGTGDYVHDILTRDTE